MTNPSSIPWSTDITLLTKVHTVKVMVFPVVMYGFKSWTIKKTETRKIDVLELWCWQRFLRVPWTARRLNQSVPKKINPEYSLEGLMLKLKLQYLGHLMGRADSLEKTLMLGKIAGRRKRGNKRWDGWMVSPDSNDLRLSKLWEIVKDREAWNTAVHGVTKSWTQLNNNNQNMALTVRGWHRNRHIDQCTGMKSRHKPTYTVYFWQGCWEHTHVVLKKTGYPCANAWNWTPNLYHS